jgi:hypothetical protein
MPGPIIPVPITAAVLMSLAIYSASLSSITSVR